ncbi:uncharacterized protein PGTG_00247 [Puccinia graminis f. sp. tritici CRL 75-36-700-3]|uniref:Uncharacterized protein n=1 Tax=Puccinia graminis f. sp. tritici (strain CRL 75-36-700-3 / race SCCL) TaxID=418459 RepID=E3JQG0_PUCGT|nr:uncharacterized protein PGTG_00247 [Puccinia graminis f. sp. tritici CRL 75-36-700-3]EFP74291.2 hypothetical protein PGTG_00247 [Puccinia graminis f. sp. tritici CRL 75-36-700-3]
MPVNWTSGKAKAAKNKYRKWSKKTWKNKNDDSRRKPFRFRRSPVKKKAAKPRPVNRNGRVTGSDSEGTGSRREGCKSTTDIDEISETNSVGLQDLRSSAGHQTTAPNDQKIDVERKRRALLAMTDWAGLHIPPLSDLHHQTPTSYKARLKGKAPAQMTTPERVIVTKPASEVETSSALGLDSSSSIHSDSRANHMNTFSLSHSSHDPIVSPTPTSPRIKKPASKVKVPNLSTIKMKAFKKRRLISTCLRYRFQVRLIVGRFFVRKYRCGLVGFLKPWGSVHPPRSANSKSKAQSRSNLNTPLHQSNYMIRHQTWSFLSSRKTWLDLMGVSSEEDDLNGNPEPGKTPSADHEQEEKKKSTRTRKAAKKGRNQRMKQKKDLRKQSIQDESLETWLPQKRMTNYCKHDTKRQIKEIGKAGILIGGGGIWWASPRTISSIYSFKIGMMTNGSSDWKLHISM